jgi:hypothetical protein
VRALRCGPGSQVQPAHLLQRRSSAGSRLASRRLVACAQRGNRESRRLLGTRKGEDAFPAALLLLDVATAALAEPARVVDGDTLQLGGTQMRLLGIDAPEHSQVCPRAGRLRLQVVSDLRLVAWFYGRLLGCPQVRSSEGRISMPLREHFRQRPGARLPLDPDRGRAAITRSARSAARRRGAGPNRAGQRRQVRQLQPAVATKPNCGLRNDPTG